MKNRDLINLLADENPSRIVVMDLDGFQVEVKDIRLCEHNGGPAIEFLAQEEADEPTMYPSNAPARDSRSEHDPTL